MRLKFGHREMDSLWGMVGGNCLGREAILEFVYVEFHILG